MGKILCGKITYAQRVPWQDIWWIRRLYTLYYDRFSFSLHMHIHLEIYGPYTAFLHADHPNDWGLCCRAFRSIVEDYQH